jgi:dihydrofolate reductase
MATVIADMSMSLDGFVADADDGILTFQADETGQPHEARDGVGAVICGRRSFDVAGGWCGRHPLGAPVFVVTHSVPYGWPREGVPIAFVTDGLDSALQQAAAVAGGRPIALASPSIVEQCLNAGLVDRIHVSLVPVLLGDGVRFFDGLAGARVELEATDVVAGTGVTYLSYRVCR